MTRAASFRIIAQLIFFVFLISAFQCQRRGFSRRRFQPPPMPLPPMFPPSFPFWYQNQENPFNHNQIIQREEIIPELIPKSECPFVHIKKVTSDGLYGMVSFKNQFLAEGVSIEIEFDKFIVAFVVKKILLKI